MKYFLREPQKDSENTKTIFYQVKYSLLHTNPEMYAKKNIFLFKTECGYEIKSNFRLFLFRFPFSEVSEKPKFCF